MFFFLKMLSLWLIQNKCGKGTNLFIIMFLHFSLMCVGSGGGTVEHTCIGESWRQRYTFTISVQFCSCYYISGFVWSFNLTFKINRKGLSGTRGWWGEVIWPMMLKAYKSLAAARPQSSGNIRQTPSLGSSVTCHILTQRVHSPLEGPLGHRRLAQPDTFFFSYRPKLW